jgi:hypothetical protein
MAFVRKKRQHYATCSKDFYYLVTNKWQNGTTKQVTLAYLGEYEIVANAWWRAEHDIRVALDRLSRIDKDLAATDGCGLQKNLERDRILRKIERLSRRIDIYRQHADKPVMAKEDRALGRATETAGRILEQDENGRSSSG